MYYLERTTTKTLPKRKAHMTTSSARAISQKGRDRAAMVLMLLAAFGALCAFVGSIGTATAAGTETVVVEVWRMYGFVVFAGLFMLLALRPRHYAGVWELLIFHKGAMSVTAALVGGEATAALVVAVVDGILAAMTVAAYFLAKGYTGWARLRGDH